MTNTLPHAYKYSFGTRESSHMHNQFPEAQQIINLHQVHGDTICIIDAKNKNIKHTADGLITNKKNIILTVKTADCVPIMYIDSQLGLVGISHQGYKGTLLKMSQKMVMKMKSLGSNVDDIKILIGPAVCQKCYVVNGERLEQFKHRFSIKNNKIDLKYLNKEIMLGEGILAQNIDVSDLCTSCSPELFYSYRRGERNTCMVNFIVLV